MTANVGKLEYTSAPIEIEDCVWDQSSGQTISSFNNITTNFGKPVQNDTGNKVSRSYTYKAWGILLHDLIDQAVNTATIVKNQPVSILREGLCKIQLDSAFNAVQGNKASYAVANDKWGNHQVSADGYRTQSNVIFQEDAVAGSLVLVKIEKKDDPATYDITTYTTGHIGVVSSPASDRVIETYKNGDSIELQYGNVVVIQSNGTDVKKGHNQHRVWGIVVRDPANPPTGAPSDTSNKIAVGADVFVLRAGDVYIQPQKTRKTGLSNSGNNGPVKGGPVGVDSTTAGLTAYGYTPGFDYGGNNTSWLDTTSITQIARMRIDIDNSNAERSSERKLT